MKNKEIIHIAFNVKTHEIIEYNKDGTIKKEGTLLDFINDLEKDLK